jgi:hypothetical protein
MFDTIFYLFCAFSIWFTLGYFGNAIFSEKAHPGCRKVWGLLLTILAIAFVFYVAYENKIHPERINPDDPPEMNDESDRP